VGCLTLDPFVSSVSDGEATGGEAEGEEGQEMVTDLDAVEGCLGFVGPNPGEDGTLCVLPTVPF